MNSLEELNEEDQKLKDELDMIVERLTVRGILFVKEKKCWILTQGTIRRMTQAFTSQLWKPSRIV
jgi:hypothetical protein